MALPLVPAALLAALRVGKAVAPLVKKYGAKAVKEGKKHLKDLKTKQTAGQKKIKPATLGQRATRSAKRKITAVAGLAGAAGYTALKASEKKKLKEENEKTSFGYNYMVDRNGSYFRSADDEEEVNGLHVARFLFSCRLVRAD